MDLMFAKNKSELMNSIENADKGDLIVFEKKLLMVEY